MDDKKSLRDYLVGSTTHKSTSGDNLTNGSTSTSGRSYGKLSDYLGYDVGYAVGNNVLSRVNNWINSHNSLITDYQKRYSGRKYNYEDSYVSDSASWLDTVTRQKSKFDAEAASILDYMDQYKGYLNEDWMKSVRDTLTGARDKQDLIVKNSTNDNEFWSKFTPSEEQTAVGYTSEKLYQEWQAGQKQYAEDQVYDVEAGMLELEELKKERDAYLVEQDEKRKQAQNEESFWDSLGRWLGTTPDTTIPLAGVSGNNGNTNPAASYDKKIAALEEQIERAKYVQGYEGYMDNINADNYAADSQYVSTRTDVAMEDARWGLYRNMYDESKLFGDFLYDYINRNQDALDVATVNNTATDAYFLGFDKGFLQTMSEDEIGVYNYLYKTQGKDSANAYLSYIESDLNGRRRAQEQARWAKYAHEDPVGSSVFSTVISPLKGLSYLGQAADMLDDGKMDQDAGYNRFSYIPTSIRSQVSATIENSGKWGEVGSFAYNTGMSMADFLFTTAVSGGNQTLSLAIMGSGAAADATIAAKDRGLGDGEAFTLGTIAGLAEVAMERISLGAWLDGDLSEGALRYMLKNALSEGGEEAGTSVINLLADIMISGDKSEWNVAMQAYIDEGKTPEEAFGLVLAEQAAQIGLDTLGGIISGTAISGGTYTGASIGAGFKYGNIAKDKAKAQKLVSEGLELNPNNQYIQNAQSKLDKGKNLTGMQVRNILAANKEQITANDLKKIQKAAEKRLTDLGQTKDVAQLAEIATKWATGQDLTPVEKSFLTKSQYGARVANELLPENIASGDYSTEWAEDIGTQKVNYTAYNIKSIINQIASMNNPATYKSLEERVGTEEKHAVSESGKATIRSTGEAIDLSKVEIADFITDKKTGKITDMILKADGKEVKASDIDYADDNQSYLFSAVKHIENITPGDATAFVRGYKPDSGQTVGEYLNGIDEAFTYGYHKYSEADMGAGLFTPKLSSEQAKGAYLLGQTTRNKSDTNKSEAIKRMRTAVEAEAEKAAAEGKKAPKSKELTITYNEGGKIKAFNEAGIKLAPKQEAAVTVAKFLHKLGLGANFEFFASKESDTLTVKDKKTGEVKPARVFINDAGVEESAPAGVYRKTDGTIRIDLNAYNGRGLALYSLAHELTHFIQQWSDEKYKVLADFLVKTYEKTDMTMHQRVLSEQARLKDIRGEEISYNEAYDEVVAKAMMKMFDDGKLVERLTELKAKDKKLAQKLWEGFKQFLDKFFGVYNSDDILYKDSDDLVKMKDAFEQLQNLFAEALVEASENFQASLIAKEAGLDIMPVEDGVQYSYNSLAEAAGFVAVENDDGTRSFTRDGKSVNKVTVNDIENSPIGAFINFSLEMGDISKADADRQKKMFADICTMACKTNDFAMTMQFIGSAVFTGMKANADKQYGTTYDFPSICTKTQAVIDAMSAKMVSLGRGLNTKEIVQLYDDVFASGNPVPCPECYVFSRWIGIGGLLDNIKKYQDYYGDMDVKDVAAAYLDMKAKVSKFAEEQGISFGKAKGALTAKLTKEFNKLTEKIEKAQNQGEKVRPADKQRLAELEPMMNTVKSMTWLENVYFADSSLKKVNPNFRVPDSVLFDLNNGEAFATKYKEAWAFRTTQGAGYGKAITPYAEARLGEGVLVTNNTTNTIKGKAQGSLDNYFLQQMGKLDKKSRDALKRARMKQKIQAFIGGQRFQSTSDARYENASDYLLAALEMQAMGGMVQVYTKVDGAVPAFSAWGFSINQSLMPLNGGLDADGNVKDTGVGGMNPKVAFENRKKHESAGTITIGVNDNHIRAMFKQWVRDFIIPYHASGGKADTIAEFRRIQEGKEAKGKAVRSTDYSRTQSDKVLSDEVLRWQGKTDAQIQRIHEIRNARIAILTGGNPNMTVVRSNRFLSALYEKLNGGEWDGVKLAKSKVESQIFPNEFWDQTVTYDESAKITKDYLEYCEDLGFLHRFSGMIPSNGKLVPANGYDQNGNRVQLTDLAYQYDENGNKTDKVEDFFWKVLTDRRMYDNNGKYLAQKVVTLNDTTTDTVTGFAKHNQGREYDKAKAEALAKKIAGEQYSSQETDLDTSGDVNYHKENVDLQEVNGNVTREEVSHGVDAESQGEMGKENSGRESSKRESCERRIKEILREKVLGTNRTRAYGRGRVETKETRADFESRVRNDGLMYVETGSNALAFKIATAQNENASIAVSTLRKFGFDVIVFHGNLQRNGNDVTETSDAGTKVRSEGGLTIFISSELDIDGMETAYHEAFHASRHGLFAKHREKIADVVASNVDFESESFTEFISIIADLYAYTERNVSVSEFESKIIEEFYAWYVGKSYATESGFMQEYMAEFSDVESIKQQIDDVYAQMEANADKAFPGLLEGLQFSSQETDADNAPIFYSQMAKVVEGMKQEKFGASSVISMLRGRGVKAEEIRWSGIQAFLDGKKSVTKAELLDFINSSMLQIEETILDGSKGEPVKLPNNYRLEETENGMGDPILNLYIDDELVDTFEQIFDGSISSTGDSDIWAMNEEDLTGQILSHYAGMSYDEAYGNGSKETKWDKYTLDGGENYRELLFKMPGASYDNQAMEAHWGDRGYGVLAHARIQDFNTFIGKMLFIEEIQSDWHNAGQKSGYRKAGEKTAEQLRIESDKAYREFYGRVESMFNGHHSNYNPALMANLFEGDADAINFVRRSGFTDEEMKYVKSAISEEAARKAALESAPSAGAVPDAPFKSNYHEYVLKRLLRMAAEEGYDSIGWTTADIQIDRWSKEYAEGYRIEYDQDIPKFLKKYGKQWGTTVGKTTLDNGTEVWSMAITDAMQKSVLEEGQVLYSSQETDLDSDGKKLSKEQVEFFKDSKARNSKGNLVSLYHGSTNGGFTVFDPSYSDDKISLFLTNNPYMAATYSGSREIIQIAKRKPGLFKFLDGDTAKGKGKIGLYNVYANMTNPLIVDGHGDNWSNLSSKNFESVQFDVNVGQSEHLDWDDVRIELTTTVNGQSSTSTYWSAESLREAVADKYSESVATQVVLSAMNNSSTMSIKWNPDTKTEGFAETTREIAAKAKREGYDGVIIRNVYDSGKFGTRSAMEKGDVYIAFNSEQIKDVDNKKPTADKDMRYSSQETDIDTDDMDENAKEIIHNLKIRAMGSRYRKGVYASYSEERIVRELNSSSANKMDYAKSYIAWVEPLDFLYATTTSEEGRAQIEKEAGELDLERLRKQTQPIHLTVDFETGKIVGHEGRHRMIALYKSGVEKVAVIFDAWNDDRYNTKPVDMMKIGGQEFGRYHGGIDFYVHDMLPLSKRYADAAKKLFSEVDGSLRFSTQETDNISNRDLLANAFEWVVQNSEEYKLIQEYKGHIKLLNEYEEKLSKLNAEIRKITFGTEGERDSKKLKELQTEAKKVAENISRHDKKLLSLEASEPLRKVIERERKKEAQKTREHVKELLHSKKARAEQTELRHKIRKAVRDLDKLLNRGNKKLNVKEDMKGFVSKALELADYLFTDHISNDELIRKGITVRMTEKEAALVKETEDILNKLYDQADSLTDEEFTRLDAKRKANEEKLRDLLTAQRNERLNTPVYNLFNDLVTEYASLKNSNQDAVKAAYNEELENSLRAFISEDDRVKILKNMRVTDMTTEELNWLYRAYTMVLTNVRNANKFHVNGMNATIEQVVGQIAGDFSSRKIPDKKLAIAMQKLVNKLGWDYEKLYYALDRIGSEAFTKLIMNIADSENTVMQDVMEAAAFRDEMVEKYGFNNWDVNKEIDREFLDNTGKKFKLTLGQLMALYAYSRRDGAWDHIEYGGFVFGEAALTNPRPADSYKLSKEQCEAITNLLTKEQKGYAEDMQKYLSETMGAKGNEVSMLLYGIKMFGEKNYFPIHIAGQFKAQANESQAKAAAGFSSMSNAGFTHAQNPNAKAPFVLEGFNEIWADHVNEMSRYHGTVPALEDLRRVMNRSTYSDAVSESQSIKQLMENSYGKEAVDYFDNLYREANSGAITDKLQKTSKKLLSMFRKNSVAYSLSVLIQQPTSIIRAYAMIDKKYFGIKGFGTITSGVAKAVSDKWTKAHTSAYNEMLKYAPGVTMAKEIGGFDTHTGGSIRSYLLDTKKSLKQKWKTGTAMEKGKAVLDLVDDNAIANLPNLADKIAWIEIWNACKRETVAKHKDLVPNSDEFMQVVGDRFTEVIRATQVYDSMFAKSPMLKSKNLAVQYLVSFMNEPNTVANMAESAVRDAVRGNWKDGAKKAVVLTYATIMVGMAKSLIYAMRDDDEDETYIEKYIESLAGSLLSDFNPISYIPIARDVLSAAQGYDIERPDMAIVVDAISAVNAVIKNSEKDTASMSEEELAELDQKVNEANWKLVESITAFFGIPVKNIRRDIKGVIDHGRIASANAGQSTAQSVWDKVYDAVVDSIPFMSGKSKQDKLYGAIISGDTEYVNRMKSTYKTDDAYQSAVRKALRENDPRIKEAAQARYDGRTEEYKRIFREIQKEGKFTFDDIMSAINTELSKLTPDKVTSYYTASGYVEAIIMGNMSNAKAMKDDIIATKVANGKSKSEAEKEFASNVATGIRDAYTSGLLDEAVAEKMLMEYADKDEEEAAAKVSYWAFCEEHPEYDLSESNVNDYIEFAEPAEIPLDIFAQYVKGTKGLTEIKDAWGDVEVTKREQVLEVIDSLPLTWEQKDALYLAAGYSESKIWDVPW